MESNRELFFEEREREAFENIQHMERHDEQPTRTQSYHNRSRKEGEAVLMNGGYYRMDFIEHYVLFILEKYTAKTFMIYFDRAIRSTEIEIDHVKGRWKANSLGNIKPATHEEEEILSRPLKGDFMHRWADSVNKSLYGSGRKSSCKIEKPLVYQNHAKPMTDLEKSRFVYESSQEQKDDRMKSMNESFKRLRDAKS